MRPWLSSVAQIEDEPWIADYVTAEPGGRDSSRVQKFLYFSEQIHSSSLTLCSTRLHILSQCFSYLSRLLPMVKCIRTMSADARAVLERLCSERGEDFAGLSRMLGRNPAFSSSSAAASPRS